MGIEIITGYSCYLSAARRRQSYEKTVGGFNGFYGNGLIVGGYNGFYGDRVIVGGFNHFLWERINCGRLI